MPVVCVQMPKDSQPMWPPQCLILTEVNANAESIKTGVSVLQVLQCFCVSFVLCQSLFAQIKHSQGTPQSCGECSSPAFPCPDTVWRSRVPQAKPCPASLPTTIPGCLFLFPMQEASTLGESGENSNKHHLEALSFMSITCRLPAAKRVWHSCFPQSSKSLLCICRSNV